MPRPARPKATSIASSSDPRPPSSLPGGPDAPAPRWLNDPRLWAALIVLLTCAAFAPLFTSDFTNIDDPQTIALNPKLNPPTLASLLEFWDPRKPQMDLYVPVTYTVWSAIARLAWLPTPDAAGIHLNPWMFHGANVALHALSALVVFHILRMLLCRMRPSNTAPLASVPRTDSPTLRDHSGARLARWIPTIPIAAAGALLFALHPVQVEPVGWASGTKDVLYGLLSLIAIWGYLRSVSPANSYETPAIERSSHLHSTPGRPGPGSHILDYSEFAVSSPFRSPWYWLATLAFILAMLSKPTAIVTPLIAAALDLLVLRRPLREVARAIWPWLLLIVPVMIEGRLAQPAIHPGDYVVPLHLRPLIAADALAFYLYKLVWPAKLAFIYNRSPQAVISHGWLWWTWLIPAAAAVAVLAPLWTGARRAIRLRVRFASLPRRSASDCETASGVQAALAEGPATTVADAPIFNRRFLGATLPMAALAIFIIGVLPVLGLVPFDFQQFSTTADHYLYIAMFGPALAVAFALDGWARARANAKVVRHRGPGVKRVTTLIGIAMLAALGVRTFFQARYWHDSFSLLEHAIQVNPESPYLYDNLSKAFADDHLPDEARRWDEESVRRWPARADSHLNLASDFLSLDRLNEAESQYEAVLRLDPASGTARQQLTDLHRQRAMSRPTP